MRLDEEAEALGIELEQSYTEGGLPRMIAMLLPVLRMLKGGNGDASRTPEALKTH